MSHAPGHAERCDRTSCIAIALVPPCLIQELQRPIGSTTEYSVDINLNAGIKVGYEQHVIPRLIDVAVTTVGSPTTQKVGAGNITPTTVGANNRPDTEMGIASADSMLAGNAS
jgi:hypothetical protein